ncbi:MAG: putative signal transduction protein [Idiomarinaceae bacterium HL-53]|nr:MAG: putative signal transduction protein [Idiomarinaceae bacterium HL-53]CUS47332.1 CBS domain-containing protein [Idiomarinaceae bacterium HL-53]
MKTVNDLMCKDVKTISPFASLREALQRMKNEKVKSLVVEKQSESDGYGLITYTNILKTVIAEDGDIDLLNVYDVCFKPALGVGKTLAIKHVSAIMINHKVKRLLVLDDNQLVGFITMNDIIDEMLTELGD